ncbi:MAG: copper resistance D family protein [Acetobacteraceae bacterium]
MSGEAIFTLGDLLSALVHGTALALLFSAFGSLVFLTLLAPPAMGRMGPADRSLIERRGYALARVSLALAALGELAWLVFEAGVLAGAADPAIVLRALPVVAIKTEFGHLVLAQALALAAALLILGGKRPGLRPILATGLAGFATLLEAWHLHAAAMYGGPSFFLVCETLHVLAAALWLGSLLPLAFFARAATPAAAFAVAHRYSAFAKFAVLVLAATAFWQGFVLVGSIPALAFTAYGRLVVLKILIFIVLIGFALRHRFRLTPALAGADPQSARRLLGRSIFAETACGVLIVLVAAVLASLGPPAMASMAIG